MEKWDRANQQNEKLDKLNRYWSRKKWAIILISAADILLVAALVASNVALSRKLSMITNQLTYLMDTNNVMQTDLASMESNISAALEEESSLVENCVIDVVRTDFAGGTYDVEIAVVPKEYTDTTVINIYFGTTEYPLSRVGYQYEGSATLSVKDVFDGNVTLLFMDGSKRFTEVLQGYKGFQSSLKGILAAEAEGVPVYENGVFRFDSANRYRLDGKGLYEFAEFEVKAVAGEAELYDQDLIDASLNGPQANDGKNGFGTVSDEDAEDVTEEDTKPQVHEPVGSMEVQAEFSIEAPLPPETPVRVYVQAVSAEGYIFTVDLFNGTTNAQGDGFLPSADYFTVNYTVQDASGGVLKL